MRSRLAMAADARFVSSLVGMSLSLSYLSGPLPHILAHRGLHDDSPENSLRAFRSALAKGASHLETDVRATRDGVAVLVHDPSVGIGGTQREIATLTYHELIEARPDLEIARLADALQALPEARFNIDVKDVTAVNVVVETIRHARAQGRVLVASFNESTRQKLTRLLPETPTSASRRIVLLSLVCHALRWRLGFRRVVRGISAVQIPERFGPLRIVTTSYIRACHDAQIQIHVWTINDPGDMRRLAALGVDGIVSDRCDVVRAVLDELAE